MEAREAVRSALAALDPFVFRRRVDPKIAVEMVALVERSRATLRHAPERDLKLGPGGIREAEFFVQTLVLVWGGQEPRAQPRRHRAQPAVPVAQQIRRDVDAPTVAVELAPQREHVQRHPIAEVDRPLQAVGVVADGLPAPELAAGGRDSRYCSSKVPTEPPPPTKATPRWSPSAVGRA